MGIEELLNNSIVQSPSAPRWTLDHSIVLCGREGHPALCWGTQGQLVCAHGHPRSSWEHGERAGGFHRLRSFATRQGSPPGCCAALQAEPQPFCGSEVLLPRLSTGLFVIIEKGHWTSSAGLGHLPVHRLGTRLVIWGSWCPDEALCAP